MVMKFKKLTDSQLYQIEGNNLTLIKVAILIHFGSDTPYRVFQKVIDNDILLYCPYESDRNNLVKRDFNKYVSEHDSEIKEAINSIKEIDDEV